MAVGDWLKPRCQIGSDNIADYSLHGSFETFENIEKQKHFISKLSKTERLLTWIYNDREDWNILTYRKGYELSDSFSFNGHWKPKDVKLLSAKSVGH